MLLFLGLLLLALTSFALGARMAWKFGLHRGVDRVRGMPEARMRFPAAPVLAQLGWCQDNAGGLAPMLLGIELARKYPNWTEQAVQQYLAHPTAALPPLALLTAIVTTEPMSDKEEL